MTHKPSILLFLNNQEGGTGTYLHSLLKLSTFLPIDLRVISLYPPRFSKKTSFPSLLPNNYLQEKYLFTPQMLLAFYREFTLLKKYLHQNQPSIIISIGLYCNILVALLPHRFSHKFIPTHHNALSKTLKAKSSFFLQTLLKLTLPLFYQSASKIITVSQGLQHELTTNFRLPKKIIATIYNGVPLISSHPRTLPKNQITLLSVSRLTPQKDHITLIKAFNYLQNTHPHLPLRLIIVGEGETKRSLQMRVRSLQLSSKITFRSWSTNPTHYYQKADIYILTTHREGLSYGLLEAISHGLPSIATNVPYGPQEIIKDDEFGLLIPPASPKKLAQAILRLTDPLSYAHYSKQALLRAKFFNEQKMLSQYTTLINQLLKNHPL